MGSKIADEAQPSPEQMKAMYEMQRDGLLGSGLRMHGQDMAAQASSMDQETHRRAVARGEYMRRLVYDVPSIRALDYFDLQINPTKNDVVVFLIVKGEVLTFSEPQTGFPNKEFLSKMALVL